MLETNLFREAKYRESIKPLLMAKPLSFRQQREAAWQWGTACPSHTPREYLLRSIAAGILLSKRHADHYVFGTHLTAQERRRDYLKPDGEPFDLFIQDALYDFYGEYNACTMSDTIHEWEEELWNIIRDVRSHKHAREILIETWLDLHGPFYKTTVSVHELSSTDFTRDAQPAF